IADQKWYSRNPPSNYVTADGPSCTAARAATGSRWSATLATTGAVTPMTRGLEMPRYSEHESGISGVYWRSSTVPITAVEGQQGWTKIDSDKRWVDIVGKQSADFGPRYLNIAVLNYAGLWSIASRPYELPDTTAPGAVAFCAHMTIDRLELNISTPATDPESGVLGYKVRINQEYEKIITDWGDPTKVDLPAGEQVNVIRRNNVPGFYFVQMRAVNKYGVLGPITRSFAVADTTPPVGVQYLYRRMSNPTRYFRLRPAAPGGKADTTWVNVIGAQAEGYLQVDDPESGGAEVEYAVASEIGFKSGVMDVTPWTKLPGNASVTLFYKEKKIFSGTYFLYTRGTNGAGLKSKTEYIRLGIPPAQLVEVK
ncbi:MAG TPA: hypothetical protein VM100_05480, partial [Longimicrobiales bacterium]|nr:hypothetical protein [Longimicrobiales bacterium]